MLNISTQLFLWFIEFCFSYLEDIATKRLDIHPISKALWFYLYILNISPCMA